MSHHSLESVEGPVRSNLDDLPGTHYCERSRYDKVHKPETLDQIRKNYSLPPGYSFVPSEERPVTDPLKGCIALYKQALDYSLRFPLHQNIVDFLKFYDMCLAQFVPNTWASIISLIDICSLKGLTCNINAMRALYRVQKCNIKSNSSGWWALYHRGGYMMAKGNLLAIHGWKHEFIFIHSRTGWDMPKWNKYPKLKKSKPQEGKELKAVEEYF